MNAPKVAVGILESRQIKFSLKGQYQSYGVFQPKDNCVSYKDGKVQWMDSLYDELLFEPSTDDCSFELFDVVIGIQFHWERSENQIFEGALKIIAEHGKLRAINIVDIEAYICSVISSEMSATASLSLLQAHAVISRSWLLAQIAKQKTLGEYATCHQTSDSIIKWYDREDHDSFDVCADDHCQRYQGITRSSTELVKHAVSGTRGQVLCYGSKICDARFSKCCGGAVEEFQNCWEDTKHPYLSKLRDYQDSSNLPDLCQEDMAQKWIRSSPPAFCNTQDQNILSQVLNNYDQETNDFYRWKVIYTAKELTQLVLERSGIDFGLITDLIPVERGTSARLIKLNIVGSLKTLTIGKELEIRRSLSPSHLYSSAFVIDKEDDKFILTGAGWGHGVGLCQIGAAVMGEGGHAYSDILLHYYPGASIEEKY
ncbi:amidase [Bacteroidales bacterium]|nr:amidase [Bacteroidales bacterium]